MVTFGFITLRCLTAMIVLGLWSFRVAAEAGTFDRVLAMQGIAFRVFSANESSINKVRIEPSGLEIDNSTLLVEADGLVTGAEVGDLDDNGSPELYVYISSAGSGSYGSLVAYAVNNHKSLTPIYLPPLGDDPAAGRGYMGHDHFEIREDVLRREFPVYLEGDTNNRPTGPTRRLDYRLVPGESGWLLKLDPVSEPKTGPAQAAGLAGLCSRSDDATSSLACRAYLEGFLDGALLTDTAIADHAVEDKEFLDAFTRRAFKTRVGSPRFAPPATSMADFCIPEDLPRQEVVAQLSRELAGMPVDDASLADTVYRLVKARLPCPD